MCGEEWYILGDGPIEINAGRRTVRLRVRNTGDRPIQVGSHFHFFESNRALDFDREQAFGMRLNIPSGTAVRFEPGDEREVELVEVGGRQRVVGFNSLVNGKRSLEMDGSGRRCGAPGLWDSRAQPGRTRTGEREGEMPELSRKQYAELYGVTVGDRFRLADTKLVCEIERDLLTYGDEVVFGGGKTIRDGMGQCPDATSAGGALDLVITNAIVMDPVLGILKADIGVKNGRIAGIGKAGNPYIMDNVGPSLVIGPGTEVIAGEGLIATAGGIDAHIHMISPQQVYEALSNGITTFIGGGTGPADGTNATTCTPGPWNIARMMEASEGLPINWGFLGKGNGSSPRPLAEQIEAGAMGLKDSRGLGLHPGGYRHQPAGGRRVRRPGRHPHRHPQRGGFRGGHHRRHRRPHDPHIPHGRGRRRARARHHQDSRGAERVAVVHQPNPPLHGEHAG